MVYKHKKYNGEIVLTLTDVEYFSGISPRILEAALSAEVEHYTLEGTPLARFNSENGTAYPLDVPLIVLTISGFQKICRLIDIL